MSLEVKNMIGAHFAVGLGRNKSEVAAEYGVSLRIIGRWIDKVEAARSKHRDILDLKKHVRIDEQHNKLEGTVSRRKVWTYVNPKPTANADARLRRASGEKKKSPWPVVDRKPTLTKTGEKRLQSLVERFSHS